MNWHTNELYLWLTNDEKYYNAMIQHSRTAKEFKRFAGHRLDWINRAHKANGNEEDWINKNEIQWNELYIAFCELIGNENPKMNLN